MTEQNNNQQRTARLTIDLDVNVHAIRAFQRNADTTFSVSASRIRSAIRNFLIDSLVDGVLVMNEDGTAEVGIAGEEGFTQGASGVIDASLLFGRPSAFAPVIGSTEE